MPKNDPSSIQPQSARRSEPSDPFERRPLNLQVEVVEAFPEDRDIWMAGMVRNDNDEETGLYRREIRTLKPKTPEPKRA